MVLVALVIFVFLRTLRASIIPIVTIPVSLVGTFALMALAGFTINTLTLLALVLAIGLVVDDAIVMLENIYRHIEEGLDPFSAAIKGAREVGFAVVAMTLTLVAVYAPLAFTPGRTGRLFIEFALALAGAVVVSGFVALTLSPMMCSRLLRHNPKPWFFDRWMEAGADGPERRLRAPAAPRAGHALAGAAGDGRRRCWPSAAILPGMKRELSPLEDRGVILNVINAPDGATLDYTNRYAARSRSIGAPVPGVRPHLRRYRQPHGVPGQRVPPRRRLGRAQAHHAGDGARNAAQDQRACRACRRFRSRRRRWARASASGRSTS